MKKKTYIILFVLAVVFAVGIPGSFAANTASGIVCVLLTALFAYLGFCKFRIAKQAVVRNYVSPPVEPVQAVKPSEGHSNTKQETKRAADVERAEREERRTAYLEGRRKEFSDALSAIPRVDIAISEDKPTRKAPSDMPEIHFTNITKRTHIDKLFPLVVIDTETTGLSPRGNDIIEVSAIRYEIGFVPVSCFTTLLKSRNPIPAEASAVNHITDDMIQDKPFFSEIAASFSDYISGCNIVGHNLPFDLKFLFVCGATLPEKAKYYDTYDLVKRTLATPKSKKWDDEIGVSVPVDDYDIEDYKLEALCDYYGIYRTDAHRSLSDCFATAKVFEHLIEDKKDKA